MLDVLALCHLVQENFKSYNLKWEVFSRLNSRDLIREMAKFVPPSPIGYVSNSKFRVFSSFDWHNSLETRLILELSLDLIFIVSILFLQKICSIDSHLTWESFNRNIINIKLILFYKYLPRRSEALRISMYLSHEMGYLQR